MITSIPGVAALVLVSLLLSPAASALPTIQVAGPDALTRTRQARSFWATSLRARAEARAPRAWRAGQPATEVTIASAAAGPASRVSVPDGTGGTYVAWADFRDGSGDIFLLRVTNAGAVAAGWPAEGLVVCNAVGDQFFPIVVPDDAYGVIVGWIDYRASWKTMDGYAQRVNSAGVPQWTANGVMVISSGLIQGVVPVPDGTGGMLLAWSETGALDQDIFATRYTGAGTLATGWSATGVLVCGLAEDQVNPAITNDGTGGAIIAWEDGRAGLGETHTYAQRLNSAGAAQWAANGIQFDASLLSTFEPAVCPDGVSGAFIFWTDPSGGGTVFGQRVNSAGAAQWTAGGLDMGGAGQATGGLMAVPDGTGGAIATWYGVAGISDELRAQRVTSAGATQWPAAGVSFLTLTGAFPSLTDVVPDGTGAAYFVWDDDRNANGDGDLFAQRVSTAGAVVWAANGVAVCSADGSQLGSVGALDGSGGLLVAWQDLRSAVETDIYAQRYTSAGAAQFAADGKAVFANPGLQMGPGILHTATGDAFVFFHEKRGGSFDLKVRKFNADGSAAGPAVDLCTAAGPQFLDAVIDDGAGGAIAAWTDWRGGGEDLYTQRIDANAVPQWTANGVAICTASGVQSGARMVSDGAGGAILAWEDGRDANNLDIYAQRVNAAGAVEWTANGMAVCADLAFQQGAVIASDGAQGAIIAWSDLRNFLGTSVYAQRVNSAGATQWTAGGENIASYTGIVFVRLAGAIAGLANDATILVNRLSFDFIAGNVINVLHAQKVNSAGAPLWGAAGSTVCDASGRILGEQIIPDGSGGAYAAWTDGRGDTYDIYLQRLDATTGNGLWTANGNAVCNAAGWQHLGGLTRHSGGDLLLTWSDQRAGQSDVYAHRFDASGAPVWAANGLLVSGAARGQYTPALSPFRASAPERHFVAWTDNREGDIRYIFLQRLDANGATQWSPDATTPTTLALVSAEADAGRVHLVWYASERVDATVYRSGPERDWTAIGRASSDGTGQIAFDDRKIVPGARYGYRLGIITDGSEVLLGEVWIDVPAGFALALDGLRPNPGMGDLVVSFALASDAPALLEVHDVAGRLVQVRSLRGLGPGRHSLRLDGALPAAGVYFLKLTQGGRAVGARAAILH